jgi:hypothetical protein
MSVIGDYPNIDKKLWQKKEPSRSAVSMALFASCRQLGRIGMLVDGRAETASQPASATMVGVELLGAARGFGRE